MTKFISRTFPKGLAVVLPIAAAIYVISWLEWAKKCPTTPAGQPAYDLAHPCCFSASTPSD